MSSHEANKRADTILCHLFGIPGILHLSHDESTAAADLIADELDYIVANGLVEDKPGNPVFGDEKILVEPSGIISLSWRDRKAIWNEILPSKDAPVDGVNSEEE